MNGHKLKPSRWLLRFFRWYCHPDYQEDIEGDLMERFENKVEEKGIKAAKWGIIKDVIQLFRPGIIRSLEGNYQLNQYSMFRNYFKTAYRSMARNSLFTVINVVGLAVSMSVGLLMISFISDLLSYDNFHEKKDRIYRVITTSQNTDRPPVDLASTSVRAGYKIKETISGIEEVTQLRRGFGGDAEVGESKIPLGGLWADNSFLKVFSYPLLQGDPATALLEPYSLVLTEKSAKKLFGKTDVLGEMVKFDDANYIVTGVLQDIPKLSYIKFESLVSFATVEIQMPDSEGDFLGWSTFTENYTYLVLPKNRDLQTLQASLDQLCAAENSALENQKINLSLQPLDQISISNIQANELGHTMDLTAILVLVALTFIVILSAGFNYTNLSIARSLKRSREVGIRKVIGALKRQVMMQFITESVMISLLALVFSFPIFLFLRGQFFSIHPSVAELVYMDLNTGLILRFIALAILIGLMAGFFPALFFSKIKSLQVLKGVSSMHFFGGVNMRKSLIVIQYVFSLIFITTTIIGYSQYKGFLTFDLGFTTENIVNIKLQGNKADILVKKLSELPEVSEISQSRIITSLGMQQTTQIIYNDPNDSSSICKNTVDEHYFPLHKHEFLAGRNFRHRSENAQDSEVIVNELLIKRFGIGDNDPKKAIGEVLTVDGKKAVIVGVVKDFHYQIVQLSIQPFIIRYSANPGGYLNAKIATKDWPATYTSLERAWKEVDNVHQLDVKFYDDQIEQAYSPYAMMVKVIGFLSFLAIFISSIGLFGMVVFTTETRLKEISIRKVLGAGDGNLIFLLSKSFFFLLILSALIALPITYFFFKKVVLINFAYHQSIGLVELLAGFVGVLIIAFLMIGSQTLKAARTNPAQTLSDE